uniref:RWD domain-containing protein n=1 Tax=Riptortus pedestris TaxID=329032 RepID=R4WDF4_RIPPE|nr:conserved hypothetical protein [Riptortus pedestris]
MEELQEEEREVILSIYDCDPAFKQLSPTVYQYKYGEDGDPRSFLLELSWGKEYPNEPPQINMNTFYNKHINDTAKDRVCKSILQEAENFLGCAMTYSLFEYVKEKHFELITIDDTKENKETREDDENEETGKDVVEEECSSSSRKVKKEILTKAQKRKQWNRVDCHGERPRGWNWVDVIHHLAQTGPKKPDTQTTS